MSLSNQFLGFLLLLSLAAPAHSSVYDRIDHCEKQGGGACVFSLLRELAGKNTVENKCVCSTAKAEVTSDCFMKQEFSLRIDGRLLKTGCGEDSDQAYSNCLLAMKKHELCP